MKLLSILLLGILLLAACRVTTPFSERHNTYTNRYCDAIWTPLIEKENHFYFEGIKVTPHPSVRIESVHVIFQDPAANYKEEAYGRPEPSDSFVFIGSIKVAKSPGLTGTAFVKTSGASEPIRFELR